MLVSHIVYYHNQTEPNNKIPKNPNMHINDQGLSTVLSVESREGSGVNDSYLEYGEDGKEGW